MKLNRRNFIGLSAASTLSLGAPRVFGMARPRVVVVGGGAGGASAARTIALQAEGAVDIVLVEPTRTYYTCFFSNLYIGGFRDYASLGHGYGMLASDYGINVVHDWAVGVDRDAREVHLASGPKVSYDKLILSPGIDFVDGSVPGWDVTQQNAMPHAYKAGSQTQLLKAQIDAMPQGGTYAMVAPPNPYRCPPGPYERVSMVAHQLKQSNPTAKILIADPKPKFSKQTLFEEGWEAYYGGMIERIGPDFGGANFEVRPDSMELVIDGTVEKIDVCNVIPAQRAGDIAARAGLTNDEGWAPVHAENMRSKMDEHIHVLGDAAQQGDMPKSGFSANSQAKVCASSIMADLTGSAHELTAFSNTCWSLIAPDDGVKVGASYEATTEKIAKTSGFVSDTGESAEVRRTTYLESEGWYLGITTDMFG